MGYFIFVYDAFYNFVWRKTFGKNALEKIIEHTERTNGNKLNLDTVEYSSVFVLGQVLKTNIYNSSNGQCVIVSKETMHSVCSLA